MVPGFGNAILPSTGCVWPVSLRDGKVKMEGRTLVLGFGFFESESWVPQRDSDQHCGITWAGVSVRACLE